MAAVNAGTTNLTAGTYELDVSTTYTLLNTTSGACTTTIDGGDASEIPQNAIFDIGPGVAKIVIGSSDTAVLVGRNR
jgi:hypothetical protein